MSCSKFFAYPYANYSPAILQFAPEVTAAYVSKEWNVRTNDLLRILWNKFLPESLKSEKAAIDKELGTGAKYTCRFEKLNIVLVERLRTIHASAPKEIATKFAGSLWVGRILSMQRKIERLPHFQQQLVSDKHCFEIKRRIFEFIADIGLPQVSKGWCRRMDRTLKYHWWKLLPKSLKAEIKQIYHLTPIKNRNYFALFRILTEALSTQLAKLDGQMAHEVHKQFKDSLSPQRVIVMQEKIVHFGCLLKIWKQTQAQVGALDELDQPRKIEKQFRYVENTEHFGHVRCMDISNMHLTTLPLELVRLTGLRVLVLSDNNLTDLPEFLFNFLNLRKIVLADNPFPAKNHLSIARKIADHPHPEIFVLGDTPVNLVVREEVDLAESLKRAWKEIRGEFPDQLEGVYANPEQRRRLKPSEIRKLLLADKNRKFLDPITHLDLRKSALHELAPEIFLGLRNLEGLSLAENPLRNLPLKQMRMLKKLEYLDLTSTDFSPHDYHPIAEGLRNLPALKLVVHHSPDFTYKQDCAPKKEMQKPPTTTTTTQKSACCVVQ